MSGTLLLILTGPWGGEIIGKDTTTVSMRSKSHGSSSCRESSTGRGSLLWELCSHRTSFPQGTPQVDVFSPLWSLLVNPAGGMVAVLSSHSQKWQLRAMWLSKWFISAKPCQCPGIPSHLVTGFNWGQWQERLKCPTWWKLWDGEETAERHLTTFFGTSWCKPALGNQAVGRMLTDLLAGALYVGKHTFSQK